MTTFAPFPATRYVTDRVSLGDVVAPPYDVIDDADRDRLEALSPYNAVRLELSRDEDDRDRYTAASCRLDEWLAAGILAVDASPAFYVYRMGFVDAAGRPRQTTGVLGALSLDAAERGDVLPHERTMGRPLDDRLRLIRACRANISPIWGLSLAQGLTAVCEPTGPPSGRLTDRDGVHHRLWPVTAPAAIEAISETVAGAPVVIADGHHRYQTALAYRAEQRLGNGDAPSGADRTLAYVVELADDQLLVRAIHRAVSGLPAEFDLVAALEEHLDVEAVTGETAEAARTDPAPDSDSLSLVVPGGVFRLHPRHPAEAESLVDSELVSRALADLPHHQIRHHHSAAAMVSLVEAGQAQAAFLLRPVTVAHLTAAATAGVRLPEKSTYFHPKPVTGLVFRQLQD